MKVESHFRNALLFSRVILGFFVGLPLHAQADDPWVPIYHPTLQISRTTGQIKIDGDLNDPGWRGAARADHFAEHNPGDQTKPTVETEAFMTYDDDNIYIAFVCDDDPSTIRASLCERDRIWNDDCIIIPIDTYGDGAWAYELAVNPYGIQGDLLFNRETGEDDTFDMIWESSAKITDRGYQVEIAIPLAGMRFPNKEQQVWKMDFWRNRPREVRYQMSWVAMDRDEPCWPCQWGTITGIENVKPGRGIELLPAMVGFQSGARDGDRNFVNQNPDGEMSLNAKYALASNITAEATINPDFSQIESDAAQIDVNTTFELSYAERRPFFQEGSDLFQTSFQSVYTRSIYAPLAAAKVIGRMNRTSIAYLAAYDERSPIILPFEEKSATVDGGRSLSNILRFRQTMGQDSYAGFMATDRRLRDGGAGSLAGADGSIRFLKNYQFRWQALGTQTREPSDTAMTSGLDSVFFDDGAHTAAFNGESFGGHAYHAGVLRDSRHLNFAASYTERSPTFRADNGFETANNQRKGKVSAAYIARPEQGFFTELTPQVTVSRQWNFRSTPKKENITLDMSGYTRVAQTNFHTQYLRENERFHGQDFADIWNGHFCLSSRPGSMISCGGYVNYGHQIARRRLGMGRELRFGPWFDFKPVPRLLIESALDYARSNHLDTDEVLYEGFIARSRWNFQFTRQLSVRLVVQYDDFARAWEVDPLLTYRVNSFSVLYFGTTYDYNDLSESDIEPSDWALTSRQFFAKVQYLVQL